MVQIKCPGMWKGVLPPEWAVHLFAVSPAWLCILWEAIELCAHSRMRVVWVLLCRNGGNKELIMASIVAYRSVPYPCSGFYGCSQSSQLPSETVVSIDEETEARGAWHCSAS